MKNVLDMFKLDGKKAVVTGASGGIGHAVAVALAQAGADVVVHYHRQADKAQQVVEEIKSYGRDSFAIQADISDYDAVQKMAAEIEARWGKVDILFNNAGMGLMATPEDCTQEEWLRVIDVNLNGVFYCAQAFGRIMIKNNGGSIINTGSMSADIINRPEEVSYSASKAGVHLMTKGLAACWAKYNVRVNAIAPGYINTEMGAYAPCVLADPAFAERYMFDATPQHRAADSEELSGLVVYMASEASTFMTGSCVTIDGGYTIW